MAHVNRAPRRTVACSHSNHNAVSGQHGHAAAMHIDRQFASPGIEQVFGGQKAMPVRFAEAAPTTTAAPGGSTPLGDHRIILVPTRCAKAESRRGLEAAAAGRSPVRQPSLKTGARLAARLQAHLRLAVDLCTPPTAGASLSQRTYPCGAWALLRYRAAGTAVELLTARCPLPALVARPWAASAAVHLVPGAAATD